MKVDDMLRQARGTVDNITELAARLRAVEREFAQASSDLDDACTRLAAALRVDDGDITLASIAENVEKSESRRRLLEAGVRHVMRTITNARFSETAIAEARIELNRLLPESERERLIDATMDESGEVILRDAKTKDV